MRGRGHTSLCTTVDKRVQQLALTVQHPSARTHTHTGTRANTFEVLISLCCSTRQDARPAFRAQPRKQRKGTTCRPGGGVKKLETITDLFFTFNCCVFFLSSVRVSFFTIGTKTTDNTDTTTDGNERTTRQENNKKGRGPATDYRGEQNQLQKNDRSTLTRRDVARN